MNKKVTPLVVTPGASCEVGLRLSLSRILHYSTK